ncbi:hypothetical protein GOEFS_024_00070 [Gordonia effusa NBRC 100432]|uniref:Uncharacterized protein n=1 Tax=Gordonia effusa NBRC 100432 TaxID=1077974 RepID=H0QWW7_9ACTN|nr:hypothetical protein [Gordonia effusa]GAB17318.1 hypothetical protein GOEFS_024_00070 [Gordonia effusa NBRC 100432]
MTDTRPLGPEGNEFGLMSDGSVVPFKRSDVSILNEWDYAHFMGEDGTGGGGHHYQSRIPYASKFPSEIDSLDDLRQVQSAALRNYSLSRYDAHHRSYVFRALISVNKSVMIVDIAIDSWGEPRTIYPVNGNDVWASDALGAPSHPLPLDLRLLSEWE